jgi:DNA invertase Pin-like site-specific DNA recombinase
MSGGQPAIRHRRSRDVVIYLRVSTEGQSGPTHTSLEVQERLCREYAATKGYVVSEVIHDVGSAYVRGSKRAKLDSKGNPVLGNKLTRFVNRETRMHKQTGRVSTSVFLVYSYDRFARDVVCGLQMLDKLTRIGISVESCTGTSIDSC